ncbi:hypothetical protein NW840_03900 [Synechococcus sp. R5-13]
MAELPQIPPVILPQSSLFNLDLAGIPVAPGLHLEKKNGKTCQVGRI